MTMCDDNRFLLVAEKCFRTQFATSVISLALFFYSHKPLGSPTVLPVHTLSGLCCLPVFHVSYGLTLGQPKPLQIADQQMQMKIKRKRLQLSLFGGTLECCVGCDAIISRKPCHAEMSWFFPRRFWSTVGERVKRFDHTRHDELAAGWVSCAADVTTIARASKPLIWIRI